jgi:hypothetical protein
MTPTKTFGSSLPDTAGACGPCCDVCPLYIATRETPDRLPALAARMSWAVEDTHCDGCRAARRSPFCSTCDLRDCAEGRGLQFCGECTDYPCAALEEFQRERPHRSEIFQYLERIAEVGVEAWQDEIKARYSCPSCGTLNGWYALECRNCGHKPGSAFVADHQAAIMEMLRGT